MRFLSEDVKNNHNFHQIIKKKKKSRDFLQKIAGKKAKFAIGWRLKQQKLVTKSRNVVAT